MQVIDILVLEKVISSNATSVNPNYNQNTGNKREWTVDIAVKIPGQSDLRKRLAYSLFEERGYEFYNCRFTNSTASTSTKCHV
jgi:hypothetical protein